MKRISSSLFSLMFAMSLSVIGHAQTAGPLGGTPPAGFVGKGGARAGGALGMLKLANTILDGMLLTPEQKSKITSLEDKLKADAKALRKQAKLETTPDEKKATLQKVAALSKEFRTNLLEVLTPAQQVQFKAAMKAEMEKRKKAREAAASKQAGSTPPPTR